MAGKTHHVVPNPKGGWSVKRGGSYKASKTFDTKRDATNYGRQVSRNQKSELVVHTKNGRIQMSDSHGNDPNPPGDKDTHN
jgi:hypothetical protein